MRFSNRVTDMLGVELPVIRAPMGWIARSQLASMVLLPLVRSKVVDSLTNHFS